MSSNNHPYKAQPAKAFWRQTVQNQHFLEIPQWYTKKWPISQARIATAGSCFAQHIGRYLRDNGFNYVDVERPPAGQPLLLQKKRWQEYGYGLYSARYGNIYTSRQLLQLLQQALGEFVPEERAWPKDQGYVDPFRPTLEPEPMTCPEEVVACRKSHLEAVLRLFEQADVFIFTLGLTETWASVADGAVYPLCPGTQGGYFDSQRHRFINLGYQDIMEDMESFMHRARQIKPNLRFLLTVSPVPLMATATSQQVVVASSYSKSVLRAVAGDLSNKYPYVDYFPSFEIISSHVMRGHFYNPDLRTVVEAGVDHVMRHFFSEHAPPDKVKSKPPGHAVNNDSVPQDPICDEVLLAAFGDGK